MAKKGWIKLWRSVGETDRWLAEPFTRGQAWIDLLLMACYAEGDYCQPGDVFCSMRTLRARWQWSYEKTLHFLQHLEAEGLILFFPPKGAKRPEKQPLLRLVAYGMEQEGPPQNRPPISSRPGSQQPSRPPAEEPENVANKGPEESNAVPDQPINRPEDRPPSSKEDIIKAGRIADAAGIKNQEIPPEYRDKFSSWEEYIFWRYQ